MSTLTGFRISPQQAAWWRERQVQSNDIFVTCVELESFAPVHEDQLRNRLRQLMLTEEILRTELLCPSGMMLPIQVIADEIFIPLNTWQFCDLGDIELSTQLAKWRTTPVLHPPLEITLVKGALVKGTLGKDLLLLKASTGYLDTASLVLLGRRLLLDGDYSETLQYADYAEWKQSLLEPQPDHAGQTFWHALREETLGLPLPGISHPPTAEFTPTFIEMSSDISSAALREKASRFGLGLEEFLFCTFSLWLARLRRETIVRLAWLDTARGEGLEDALGTFEQALPVIAETNFDLPLKKQLDGLLKQKRMANGWSDYYDSMLGSAFYFAYRRYSSDSNLTLKHATSIGRRFVLGLDCFDLDGADENSQVTMRLAYDSAQIDERVVNGLVEQWRLLLCGLSELDEPVGRVCLFGAQQKLMLAADHPAPEIKSVDVLSLIAEQARLRPDQPALADADGVLTYGNLWQQVERLANVLVGEGVAPGEVVGIFLRRGNHAIVAMLAAMRAAATYVPLDPSYPAERLAFMCQDSELERVITSGELTALLPEGTAYLLLEQAASTQVAQDTAQFAPLDLEQTAYLIYTSGSTGQPKAVEITHANLSHSTQVRLAFYAEPVAAYLVLSSFSFDSSVAGIYWTLAQGGLLVLPADREELDLTSLLALIGKHRISHALSLPSVYEALLDFAEPGTLDSLSTWIVAGEACQEQVVIKHQDKAPQARLANEYGPTEATVWATAAILTEQRQGSVTIGRPIPTMKLFLVNEQGGLAALGEPGEIYLGGPTLARGYRNRPEQTAQVFVERPAIAGGERLYKTGDLARWCQDGNLEFLGRADQQVKIRGYRIELSEIERQILTHGDAADAVVLAQPQAGSQRLVAYVTPRKGSLVSAQVLADHLLIHLPPYMVPSAWVALAAIPRMPNGKLDRKALPDPDQACTATTGYVAPESDMEIALAAICADVLRRERVGATDNFFQIGGDSILSLQIVARANQRGIRISAREVFECETVAQMARVARRVAEGQVSGSAVLSESDSQPSTLTSLDDDAFAGLLAELSAPD